MSSEEYSRKLKSAFSDLKWKETHFESHGITEVTDVRDIPRSAGYSAKITPGIRVICWEIYPSTQVKYLAVALDPCDNVVGRTIKRSIKSAISSVLIDACIWLASQTDHIIEVVGDGADVSFLKRQIESAG